MHQIIELDVDKNTWEVKMGGRVYHLQGSEMKKHLKSSELYDKYYTGIEDDQDELDRW